MKTLRTLAVMFVACLVCLPGATFAENNNNNNNNNNSRVSDAWLKQYDSRCIDEKTKSDKYKDYCRDGKAQYYGKTASISCNTAESEWKTTGDSFLNACGSLGGGGGLVECAEKKMRCECLNKNLSSNRRSELKCDEYSDSNDGSESESSRGSSSSKSLGLINIKEAGKRLDYCPAMSAEDSEKFEKKLEKTEEKIKELKKQIPELQAELAKVDTDLQTNLEKIEEEQTKAADDHAKELEQASQEKDQKQKEMMNQVSQLQTQIGQANEQVGAVELAKIDAYNGLNTTKNKVNLECIAQASNVVGKMQTDALEQIKAGTYNVGGQADLFQKVGLSDRESWQRVAKKYHQWCIESEAVNMQKGEANTAYESALRKANQSKADINKRKEALQAQIEQIKNSNGCGAFTTNSDGTTNESEMCKANRQAAEKMQRLEIKYQQSQINAQRKQQRAQMAADQKRQQAYGKMMQAQQEMMDETRRLDNLREYLDLKMNKGLSGAGKDSAKDFNLGWSKLQNAAAALDTCCMQDSSVSTKCGTNGEVARFLDAIKISSQQTLSEPTARSSSRAGSGEDSSRPKTAPAAAPRVSQ